MACNIEDKKNLGLVDCNEFPGLINGMIETNNNFVIPAADIAAGATTVLATLQAGMIAGAASRTYYWPPFASFENVSEDAVYQDSPLLYRRVRDGNYRFKFGISQNMCIHKAMYTHRRTNGRVIFTDQEGNLLLTKLSNGDYAGFSVALLNTEKLKFSDGSVATESPILIALANNAELDRNGVMFDASGFIGELYRIVDVNLVIVGTPTSSSIVVKATADCDGTPLSGLVVGDFLLVDDDDGLPHTISSAVESASIPGQYTLSGTLFEDSVLSLKPAATLSVKAYEAISSVEVIVP